MKEDQLLFLISQPRSGSSLTQQLLLNNKCISSTPEPWVMLPLIHTYKSTSISSGYNPNFTAINFQSFLNSIDEGLPLFKSRIKDLALNLYDNKLNNKDYFLDKTPRYYHIIDELYELFPNAKFVFLVRNPLSVFSSILDYNYTGKYFKFLSSLDRLDDLFLAPIKISQALKKYDNNILIKYEELVENPKQELKKVFDYLSLDEPENIGQYLVEEKFIKTNSVDSKSLEKHTETTNTYINAWRNNLETSQKKKIALDYLLELQKQHTDYFGYDIKAIELGLKKHKPLKNYIFNLNLELLTKKDEELRLFELLKKRLILKFQNE